MLTLDRDGLRRELEALSDRHRVAFAAACSERLLPNYAAFAAQERWGDAGALRRALDAAWRFAEDGVRREAEWRALLAACEAVTPDTEADWSGYGSSDALDAGVAVCSALDCCLTGDAGAAIDAAVVARDTAVGHAETLDPDLAHDRTDAWRRHPFVQAELRKQRADLQTLAAAPELTPSTVGALRRGARDGAPGTGPGWRRSDPPHAGGVPPRADA